MINVPASQLEALEGAIYVHFINETTFRAVYVPNVDLSMFDYLPLFRNADKPSKNVCEEKSDYSFEHAFYLLLAKVTKNESLRIAMNVKYATEPIPGIGRITKVKTRIDAFLISPFIASSVAVYQSSGRVVAQVEWMGTKTELPGCHAANGYGRTVEEAIEDVLKREPLSGYCYVPQQGEKKEPVCS